MNRQPYEILARKVATIEYYRSNEHKTLNAEEIIQATISEISDILDADFPSGSGFDHGTKLDLVKSTSNKLVFETAFHHMDEYGGYDGWTEHNVIVTPSLIWKFDIKITGRNRNDIKDYIRSQFEHALSPLP